MSRELARLRYEATYEEVAATPIAVTSANKSTPFVPDETLDLDHRVQRFLAASGIVGEYAVKMGCFYTNSSTVSQASGIPTDRLGAEGPLPFHTPVAITLTARPSSDTAKSGLK